MADTTVKYFHSGMSGAPVLSGTAGAAVAVLDACLVDGFGLITADSVTISGNVATVTKSTGHSMEVDAVALIAGATVIGGSINGEQKVTSVTATTFTFATTGLSNQTATGTITAKLAPAGWAKTYSGTNKAAYKSADVTATGCLLRVDDTGTTNARVVGYETMSDVDTGTGPFPTSVQQSGGGYWPKSQTANSTARNWILVSDSKMFYFASEHYVSSGSGAYDITVFGDVIPTKSGDAYACVLSLISSDVAASVGDTGNYASSHSATVSSVYMPRSYTGIGSSKQMLKMFPYIASSNNSNWSGHMGGSSSGVPYPNTADGGLYVSPHYLLEGTTLVLRGTSPGFYCCPQYVPPGTFAARDTVTGVTGLTGKTLKCITTYGGGPTPYSGPVFLDVTGPWR